MPTATKKQPKMPKALFDSMLAADKARIRVLFTAYDPLTGRGAPGKRVVVTLSDFMGGKRLYLPIAMLKSRFIRDSSPNSTCGWKTARLSKCSSST